MLYDDAHVYLNGEAFRAGGRDATLMRALADARRLGPAALARLSAEARGLLRPLARGRLVPKGRRQLRRRDDE
jgi:hypothetical protein